MDNVEQYRHWYYIGIVGRDIEGWYKDQSFNWANNLEFKKELDFKIEFYNKLIKGGKKK